MTKGALVGDNVKRPSEPVWTMEKTPLFRISPSSRSIRSDGCRTPSSACTAGLPSAMRTTPSMVTSSERGDAAFADPALVGTEAACRVRINDSRSARELSTFSCRSCSRNSYEESQGDE